MKSLGRCQSKVRKIIRCRNFSSHLAERARGSTPGTAPPGRIGRAMARWNRKVEPEGQIGRGPAVRPNGAQGGAWGAAHRMADWRRRAGEIPHGPPPVSLFVASFRGASAGRGRCTSGVDRADIGRGTCHVKGKYRKKGNIFEDQRHLVLPPLQRIVLGKPCVRSNR